MTNQNDETQRNQEIDRRLRLMGQIEYIVGKSGQYGGLLTGVSSLIDDNPYNALIGLSLYVGGNYLSEIGFAKRVEREWRNKNE